MPYRQQESLGFGNFYVRTEMEPEQLLTAIPGVVKALDPNLPVDDLKTMEMQIKENVFIDRMISVFSTGVRRCWRRCWRRSASTACWPTPWRSGRASSACGWRSARTARRVRGMVLKQVAVMAVIGGLIGLVAAAAIGQAAQSMLFEIKGYDPGVIAGATVVLALVTLMAGYLPALRASKIDPMKALRYE